MVGGWAGCHSAIGRKKLWEGLGTGAARQGGTAGMYMVLHAGNSIMVSQRGRNLLGRLFLKICGSFVGLGVLLAPGLARSREVGGWLLDETKLQHWGTWVRAT
jgi:hypothetical protein